ncbi:MAG: FHA domain-containing protein, partial [Myxococcota bacterium]
MARPKSWGDDLTDPGVPGPASDATVVGPAPGPSEEPAPGRCAHKPKKQVHLGSVPEAEPLPEKTRVASMDDVFAPESAEKTVMVANPMLGGEEEQVNGADVNPDATMITANPLATGRSKQKRLVGRLVVTEGKEKGRTIELTEGTKVLGRSKDCDVTLLDIQISRRHVEITADHNGVRIVDLGSGNGTFVNDERLETVNLVHGDEIAVGDHLLRFEEEGPVASALPALVKKGPAPVASRRAPGGPPATAADVVRRARHRRTKGGGKDRRKLLILVGGALVLVAFTGIALGLKKDPAPPEPSGPTPQEEAQSLYLAGMQKFRDGAFQEALASFEAAIEKMPEHREAGRYVSATRREIAARDALSRGNALLEQQEYDEARQVLRQVDPDSLCYQEAQ